MEKPKILVLTSSYPSFEGDYSGLFVEELSNRLTHSFNVFVLSPQTVNSKIKECRNGVNIFRYKYWLGTHLLADGEIMANLKKNKLLYLQVVPFLFFQLLAIKRIVKSKQINKIHAHWLIPQTLIAIFYKLLFNKTIRVVATVHGGDINNFKTGLLKHITKFVLRNIDEVTVVSNAIKENILSLGYRKTVHVYPMGIDTQDFSPSQKDNTLKNNYDINGYFLLFVGGVIQRKGIHQLIEALPAILKDQPKTKLIVVGQGNLETEMKTLSKKIGVDQNIIFTGALPHKELPRYFATADVFILPSFSEGFGLVVAEAISSGTLTIASNLKPINDIIIENKTGFYLKNIDSQSIAEKIIEVLKNKDHYQNIAVKGREHIVSNFDWKIVGNNYTRLFLNLGK